jgi:hypothetical protein
MRLTQWSIILYAFVGLRLNNPPPMLKMVAVKAAALRDPSAMGDPPAMGDPCDHSTKRKSQDQGGLAKAACTKKPEEALVVWTPPPMHAMTHCNSSNQRRNYKPSLKRKVQGALNMAYCIKEPEPKEVVVVWKP